MAATATVTGKVGPGNTLTAAVFQQVAQVQFDCVGNILTLIDVNGSVVHQIDVNAATTITATKSGSTYTFTVS